MYLHFLGVFLHDYRIKTEGVKVRTTRQTKSNSNIKDTFYWPDMTVRLPLDTIRFACLSHLFLRERM
jgi:hypothetical protein